MGMIQCVKHGLSGIAINIENSICEKINKNQELFSSNLSVVKVYLYDGEEYLYNLNYIITNETKKKYNLKSVYKIHNEEDEKQLKDLDSLVGVICNKCLNDYQFINKIKNIINEYKKRD
ncbi:hypothetical protein OIU80_15675 [Flavobacterium sp. LS1R47]|uniref:Uncharacterized protein n=1 Tax=Flavobacterium frigoritolerans TaxID=2987686 RepID=A0A9X2Z0P0_9FLAO|nr:hypothetical protein [Flavobacterium frigoritolerans]MCV9933723.1 hypothetical protein [Flavobacterium frigoritolerans]